METLVLDHATESELRLLTPYLDRLHFAVMLLDGEARVQRANRAAVALLRSARGLALCGGRLVSTLANGAYVQRAVAGALASGAEVWVPVARDPQPPIALLLLPGAEGRVLAVASAPERVPVAQEAALRRLFALTRAEARVAARLARGASLARIAFELGVQPNTCRSHLKSAYEKTGTRCQSQLAVLVATSVAVS